MKFFSSIIVYNKLIINSGNIFRSFIGSKATCPIIILCMVLRKALNKDISTEVTFSTNEFCLDFDRKLLNKHQTQLTTTNDISTCLTQSWC